MKSTTPAWRKSSHSGGDHGACVEVAVTADGIGVRDSKNRDAPYLSLKRDEFAALLHSLKLNRHTG